LDLGLPGFADGTYGGGSDSVGGGWGWYWRLELGSWYRAISSAAQYEIAAFRKCMNEVLRNELELVFLSARLSPVSAPLASDYDAICTFTTDQVRRKKRAPS